MATARRPWTERFWEKVDRTGDCWVWTAATRAGYGAFGVAAGDVRPAHRLAFEMAHGPIPPGMVVMHACDNPPCVRPSHLRLGTHADNVADAVNKGRNARGNSHGRRRIGADAVEAIRGFVRQGGRQRDAAAAHGISEAQVSMIVHGKRWPVKP